MSVRLKLRPIVKLPVDRIHWFVPMRSLILSGWYAILKAIGGIQADSDSNQPSNSSRTTQHEKSMLRIVYYPHPTLSFEAKPVIKVDAQLRKMIDEMFELMYEFRGVGLAATQVDLPVRLFVVNESGQKGSGEEQVFINPVLSQPKGSDEAEEGCLSLPGVYATVRRPKQIHIQAYDLKGMEINQTVDGFLARVMQHEYDHLNGIMFIDRIPESDRLEIEEKIDEVAVQFDEQRRAGLVGDDAAIEKGRRELMKRYCGA